MLSYLSNRRYQRLTRELPIQLQKEQTVFFDLFNCEPHWRMNLNPAQAQALPIPVGKPKEDDCCPVCYATDTIAVPYYNKKHVCIKCRNLVRDQYGNQIRIFLDQSGDIVCLGMKVVGGEKYYYGTDYMRLEVNGWRAYATFAEELVIVLRNE